MESLILFTKEIDNNRDVTYILISYYLKEIISYIM